MTVLTFDIPNLPGGGAVAGTALAINRAAGPGSRADKVSLLFQSRALVTWSHVHGSRVRQLTKYCAQTLNQEEELSRGLLWLSPERQAQALVYSRNIGMPQP